MEDLEGELERKLELLEKERKALRLETEKHKEKIDHGISKLQNRISGLKNGNLSLQEIANKVCPYKC